VTYTTSPAGYDLIRRFEGCEEKLPDGRIRSYKKGADPQTIGWGQTGQMPDGRRVVPGLIITQQEADDALQYFVRNVTEPLVRKHFVCRSQAEFDACVSWVYNVSAAKLEAGKYSLPQLVNTKDRNIEALVELWLRYIHTPGFENGLYKRRIAEVLMFLGLPWNAPSVWGYVSKARYKTREGTVDPTDPWFILELAEQAKPIASLPDPPKPAKPVIPVKAEPLPEVKPAKPTTTVKKPPSPNTKAPVEVGLDPNAGLKHVSESDRAKGWMLQQFGLLLLRLSTLGLFGNGAAVWANTMQSDATLMAAAFELAIPLVLNGGALASSYVVYHYGRWKEYRGRVAGSQALYV
jgi:GH24 family phage-related lysozyme (muramidase)